MSLNFHIKPQEKNEPHNKHATLNFFNVYEANLQTILKTAIDLIYNCYGDVTGFGCLSTENCMKGFDVSLDIKVCHFDYLINTINSFCIIENLSCLIYHGDHEEIKINYN